MDRDVAAGLVRSANRSGATPKQSENPYRGLIPEPEELAIGTPEQSATEAADLKQAERMKLAKEGKALPDGSFPIRNVADLKKARVRAHQADNPGAAKRHIKKRERALGVSLGPIGAYEE
jgi:hypothetical protein